METAVNHNQFNFIPEAQGRRPRAWERVPRTSHAKRHRGRKGWKRYELRENNPTTSDLDRTIQTTDENLNTAVETPNRRTVKRLRNATASGSIAGAPDATQYIVTLCERGPGTPKSRPILNNSNMFLWSRS